jgi:hypothetical protein
MIYSSSKVLPSSFAIDHTNVQRDRDNNFPGWDRKGAMVVFPFNHQYTVQEQTFGQGYRTIVVPFRGIFWMHILACILLDVIAWVEFLVLTLFIISFGLGLFKSLDTYYDLY